MTPTPETAELQSVIDSLGGVKHAKEIASALSKTIDGMPIYPGMPVYLIGPPDPQTGKRRIIGPVDERLTGSADKPYSTCGAATANLIADIIEADEPTQRKETRNRNQKRKASP